jgi:hypothetical protein
VTERAALGRLRRFLLGLAAALLIGTVAELVLTGHDEDAVQLIPFGLCAVGLAALLLHRLRPGRASVMGLRGVMVVTALGSLLGVAQHLVGNLELAREVRPDAGGIDLALATLTGGIPLLAPGILAVAAAVALAAVADAGT